MSSKFSCLHSGKCCELTTTQINLSFADVKRLSKNENISVKELFEKNIVGLQPFCDGEDLNKFDVELGLNIPCYFRQNKKCIAYKARPLNCRIFPYFLIARLSKYELKNYFDERYKCVLTLDLNDSTKEKYQKYADLIGELIMKESEYTDEKMFELGFKRRIDLAGIEFGDFSEKILMEKKIKYCKELIRKDNNKELIEKLIKEIETYSDYETLNKINDFMILLN